MTCALQRAVAPPGNCDRPERPGRNDAPGIDGTSPQQARRVERWHATSAPTPEAATWPARHVT
jgi:hypothetical protein